MTTFFTILATAIVQALIEYGLGKTNKTDCNYTVDIVNKALKKAVERRE